MPTLRSRLCKTAWVCSGLMRRASATPVTDCGSWRKSLMRSRSSAVNSPMSWGSPTARGPRPGSGPAADPPGAHTRTCTVRQNYVLVKDLQRPWITITRAYSAEMDDGTPLCVCDPLLHNPWFSQIQRSLLLGDVCVTLLAYRTWSGVSARRVGWAPLRLGSRPALGGRVGPGAAAQREAAAASGGSWPGSSGGAVPGRG